MTLWLALALQIDDPEIVKAEKEATKATLNRLIDHRVSCRLNQVAVGAATALLGAGTDLNFYVEPAVTGTVSVDVQDKPLGSALDALLEPIKAKTVVYHGIVVICPADSALKPAELPGPAPAALDPEKHKGKAKEIAAALAVTGDVEFDQTPIKDVTAFLGEQIGAPMDVAPELTADEKTTVTLSLKGMPLHVVLRLVCRRIGADWSLGDGVIRIAKKK